MRVDRLVNRGRSIRFALAAAGVVCASTPATADDNAKASLTIDPIVARDLLSPIADPPVHAYRLTPRLDQATGKGLKLRIDVGGSTLFAITGRLSRRPVPTGSLDPIHARALGQKSEGGKIYGAGIARNVGGVDISATYQYSKVGAAQSEPSESGVAGPGKSHSLQAAARIRFRP